MRNAVALIRIGVPFDVAWNMATGGMTAEIMAYLVISGEIDGGSFDWGAMRWKDRE